MSRGLDKMLPPARRVLLMPGAARSHARTHDGRVCLFDGTVASGAAPSRSIERNAPALDLVLGDDAHQRAAAQWHGDVRDEGDRGAHGCRRGKMGVVVGFASELEGGRTMSCVLALGSIETQVGFGLDVEMVYTK